MKPQSPFIKLEYYDENKIINQVLGIPKLPQICTAKVADTIKIKDITYIIEGIDTFDLFPNQVSVETFNYHPGYKSNQQFQSPVVKLRQAIREAHLSGISKEKIAEIFLLENVEFIHDL